VHRLRERRSCFAWLLMVPLFWLSIASATSAHADGGSGGCNVVKDPTWTVSAGAGGGLGTGDSSGAGGDGGGAAGFGHEQRVGDPTKDQVRMSSARTSSVDGCRNAMQGSVIVQSPPAEHAAAMA
jgi:hypothetical protein